MRPKSDSKSLPRRQRGRLRRCPAGSRDDLPSSNMVATEAPAPTTSTASTAATSSSVTQTWEPSSVARTSMTRSSRRCTSRTAARTRRPPGAATQTASWYHPSPRGPTSPRIPGPERTSRLIIAAGRCLLTARRLRWSTSRASASTSSGWDSPGRGSHQCSRDLPMLAGLRWVAGICRIPSRSAVWLSARHHRHHRHHRVHLSKMRPTQLPLLSLL